MRRSSRTPKIVRALKNIGLGLVLVLAATAPILYTRAGARVYAVANTELNFQARLLNTSGTIVPDNNTYSVVFNLYSVSSGGTTQWTETLSGQTVKAGYLSVRLGSVTPFPSTIDWSQKQWLTMNVNGDGEMSPRLQLTAVPLALRAVQADGITNGAGTLTASNLAQLAPGTPQVINSALAALRLNQTGTGALLQLQHNTSDVFNVAQNGDLTSSGSGTFSGGTLNLGAALQTGGVVLSDGSSNTGTLQTTALGSNRTYTLPDTSGTILLDTTLGSTAFVQNGNSFGATAVLGTNDSNSLAFKTAGTARLTLDTFGSLAFAQASTINVSAANGALTLNSNGSGALTLDSGTSGAINVGTNANAKVITFGNSTGASQLVFNSGTGGVQIGTNAVAQTITLGNSTGATSLVFDSGTGAINIGTNAIAHTTTIGNVTGASSVVVNCGTGACSFGASGTDHTTTLGSNTGVSITTIQAGTGGLTLGNGGIANTLQIGNTGGAVAQTINLGTNATASSTTTVNIGSTIAGVTSIFGAGGINIGTGTAAPLVQIGGTTAATNQTINIGNNATASSTDTVVIGSTLGTSTTTFQAGSGGLILNTSKIKRTASGTTTLDLIDASNTIFALTNSGTGAASLVLTDGDLSTGSTPTTRLTNAGALTNITGFSASGAFATLGGTVDINVASNNPTNINTGTSTGTITLGAGTAPLVIDSTNFDVSSLGALSGITTITTSSTINSNIFSSTNLTFGGASGTIGTTANGNLTLTPNGTGVLGLNTGSTGTATTNITTLQRTTAGAFNLELNNASATSLVLNNTGAGAASLVLTDGDLSTGSTPTIRLTNAGALTNITGATFTSGTLNVNNGGITNAGSITGVGTNITATGALTVASGGSGSLTLDSATNIIQIAASDTTLQRSAAGTYTVDLLDASADTTLSVSNSDATRVASLSVEGDVNVGAGRLYKVGNTQISSANLSNDANLAKLNGTGPQTFTGNNKFTGTVLGAVDSATAFQVQSATGSIAVLTVDTSAKVVIVNSGSILRLVGVTSDPATPVDGDFWYNSTQKSHRVNDPIGKLGLVGLFYTNTAPSNSVVNTTTETVFNTNASIPANALAAGKVIRVTARGVYSTQAITAPTLELRTKFGTTVLGTTGAVNTAASLAGAGFKVEFLITTDTIGTTGTVEAQGTAFVNTSVFGANVADMQNPATITVNTTLAQTLQLSAQWGTANPANTITIRQVTYEVLN